MADTEDGRYLSVPEKSLELTDARMYRRHRRQSFVRIEIGVKTIISLLFRTERSLSPFVKLLSLDKLVVRRRDDDRCIGGRGDVKDGASRRLCRVLFKGRRKVHPRFGETDPTACLIMHEFLDLAANELRSFGSPTPGGTSKQQRRDQIFISPGYTHGVQ